MADTTATKPTGSTAEVYDPTKPHVSLSGGVGIDSWNPKTDNEKSYSGMEERIGVEVNVGDQSKRINWNIEGNVVVGKTSKKITSYTADTDPNRTDAFGNPIEGENINNIDVSTATMNRLGGDLFIGPRFNILDGKVAKWTARVGPYGELGTFTGDAYAPLDSVLDGSQELTGYYGGGLRAGTDVTFKAGKRIDIGLGVSGDIGSRHVGTAIPGYSGNQGTGLAGLATGLDGRLTFSIHKPRKDDEDCLDFDKEDPAYTEKATTAESWKAELDSVKAGLKDMGLDDAVIGTLSTDVDYLPKYGTPDGRTPVANDFAWYSVITAKVGGKDVILWDESQLAKGGNLTPLTLAQVKTWIELNGKYVETVKKVPELQNVYRQDVYKFKTGRPTDAELGVAASKSSLAELEAYISSTILSNGAESAVEVKKLVEFINNNDLEDYKFYLHGTASVTGGDQSNWDLSNRRAKLVQIWLEKHGLHPQGSLGTGETPSFLKVGSGEAQVDKAVYVYFAPMPSPIPTSYKDTSGLAALKTYTDGVAAKPVLVVREGLAPDVVQASPVVFEDNVTFIEAVEKKTANPDENVSCDVLNIGLTPMKADGTPEGYTIPNASKNDCTVDYYPDVADSDGSTGPEGTPAAKKAKAKTSGATAPKNKAEFEAERKKIVDGTDTNKDGRIDMVDDDPSVEALLNDAEGQINNLTPAQVENKDDQDKAIKALEKISLNLAAKRDALVSLRGIALDTPPAKFGGKPEKNDYLMKLDVQIAEIEAKIGK